MSVTPSWLGYPPSVRELRRHSYKGARQIDISVPASLRRQQGGACIEHLIHLAKEDHPRAIRAYPPNRHGVCDGDDC